MTQNSVCRMAERGQKADIVFECTTGAEKLLLFLLKANQNEKRKQVVSLSTQKQNESAVLGIAPCRPCYKDCEFYNTIASGAAVEYSSKAMLSWV